MKATTDYDLKKTPAPRNRAPAILSALHEVSLSASRQRLLEAAARLCGGPAVWRHRKLAEARELLALSEIASRLTVESLDLREVLRALVSLRVPVACLPDGQGTLRIHPKAILGLYYPEVALRTPLPGFSFVQILYPTGVWHANVSSKADQMLCLGAQLPTGIPLKEIVLMAYGALSMQAVMIDERDTAGVLNLEAARWWQQNIHRVPLSREPFVDVCGLRSNRQKGYADAQDPGSLPIEP